MKQSQEKPCLFCLWANELRKAQDGFKKQAKDITLDEMAQGLARTFLNKAKSEIQDSQHNHKVETLKEMNKVPTPCRKNKVLECSQFASIADQVGQWLPDTKGNE